MDNRINKAVIWYEQQLKNKSLIELQGLEKRVSINHEQYQEFINKKDRALRAGIIDYNEAETISNVMDENGWRNGCSLALKYTVLNFIGYINEHLIVRNTLN